MTGKLNEIETTLDILCASGTDKKNITLLHCNTEYPTPMEDVNLLAMNTIHKKFGLDIGYSDHSLGIEPSGREISVERAITALNAIARLSDRKDPRKDDSIGPFH